VQGQVWLTRLYEKIYCARNRSEEASVSLVSWPNIMFSARVAYLSCPELRTTLVVMSVIKKVS
jgi:hypothetical protein